MMPFKQKWITPDWPAPNNIMAGTRTRHYDETLALPSEPCWLAQTHSTEVINLDQSNHSTKGDASFTQSTGKICAVLTADCLPLLICNTAGTEVAAIHAGWRGLASGIIEKTLKQLHSTPNTLLVWLGPAVSQNTYLVGEDVRQAFLMQSAKASDAFQASDTNENKYYANLYLLAKQRLQQSGVNAIFGGEFCTYRQVDLFFSYRRTQGTERMASMIWMNI